MSADVCSYLYHTADGLTICGHTRGHHTQNWSHTFTPMADDTKAAPRRMAANNIPGAMHHGREHDEDMGCDYAYPPCKSVALRAAPSTRLMSEATLDMADDPKAALSQSTINYLEMCISTMSPGDTALIVAKDKLEEAIAALRAVEAVRASFDKDMATLRELGDLNDTELKLSTYVRWLSNSEVAKAIGYRHAIEAVQALLTDVAVTNGASVAQSDRSRSDIAPPDDGHKAGLSQALLEGER